MYIHSISADDGSDLPDVKIINPESTLTLNKGEILDSALGYIHLSDRWDFYPPLYDAYFCNSNIVKKLGYILSDETVVEISYVKNYSETIVHRQRLNCI